MQKDNYNDYLHDVDEFSCYSEEVDLEDEEVLKRTCDGMFPDDGYDYSQHVAEGFSPLTFQQLHKVERIRKVEVDTIIKRPDGTSVIKRGLPDAMYNSLMKKIAAEEGMALGNPELPNKMMGLSNLGDIDETTGEILDLLENCDDDKELDHLIEIGTEDGGLDSLIADLTKDNDDALEKAIWGNGGDAQNDPTGFSLGNLKVFKATDAELALLKQMEDINENIDSDGLEREYEEYKHIFNDENIGALGDDEVGGGVMDVLLDEDDLLAHDDELMEYYLNEKQRTDLDDPRARAPLRMLGDFDGSDSVPLGKYDSVKKTEYIGLLSKGIDRLNEQSSEEVVDTRLDIDNHPRKGLHDCESILETKSNIYNRPITVNVPSMKNSKLKIKSLGRR